MEKWIMAFAFLTVTLFSCKNRQKGIPVIATEIAVDSANKMIGSYLQSINYTANDTDLFSLIVDAEALRSYLNSPMGSEITGLKLMFSHRLDYINSGHLGQEAGYRSDALTVVIAGYDENGDYVLLPGNNVLDYNVPCPPDCPSGDAANPLIIQ